MNIINFNEGEDHLESPDLSVGISKKIKLEEKTPEAVLFGIRGSLSTQVVKELRKLEEILEKVEEKDLVVEKLWFKLEVSSNFS